MFGVESACSAMTENFSSLKFLARHPQVLVLTEPNSKHQSQFETEPLSTRFAILSIDLQAKLNEPAVFSILLRSMPMKLDGSGVVFGTTPKRIDDF